MSRRVCLLRAGTVSACCPVSRAKSYTTPFVFYPTISPLPPPGRGNYTSGTARARYFSRSFSVSDHVRNDGLITRRRRRRDRWISLFILSRTRIKKNYVKGKRNRTVVLCSGMDFHLFLFLPLGPGNVFSGERDFFSLRTVFLRFSFSAAVSHSHAIFVPIHCVSCSFSLRRERYIYKFYRVKVSSFGFYMIFFLSS